MRAVIKYLCNKGMTPKEIYEDENTWEIVSLLVAYAFEWGKLF